MEQGLVRGSEKTENLESSWAEWVKKWTKYFQESRAPEWPAEVRDHTILAMLGLFSSSQRMHGLLGLGIRAAGTQLPVVCV